MIFVEWSWHNGVANVDGEWGEGFLIPPCSMLICACGAGQGQVLVGF